ncbi:MAG: hypothetical protein PUC65_11640, partial [Clostridiales bacterium]|nr:hypothetical protein [Clostridiales bacterium]
VIDDGACRIQGELDNICIADLDQNGISELLMLSGFGSGIYRIILNAYQYSNPVYFNSLNKILHCSYRNCFVPKDGYSDLAFKKISDTEVHLVEMKCEYVEDERGSREQITYGADFGNLVVIKNELYIAVENMSDFPYYEWDKYFEKTPDSIDSNSEKKQFSEEVPELTVTINDTTLKNFSWKDNWGTITEDPISFSELMADKTKIPTFSCPKLFEYDEEIGLSFLDGIKPESIELQDYLITEDGTTMYGESGVVKREIRYGDDGNYYVGLMGHPALYLSSNMSAYTNPSYRGFRVLCQFDDQHTCEYVFVLSIDPVNWEK